MLIGDDVIETDSTESGEIVGKDFLEKGEEEEDGKEVEEEDEDEDDEEEEEEGRTFQADSN